MKKILEYTIVVLCSVFLFMSCSDDNDEAVDVPESGSMEITMSGDIEGSLSPEFTYFRIISQGGAEMFNLASATFDLADGSGGGGETMFSIGFIRMGMVSATSYSILDSSDEDNTEQGMMDGKVLVTMNQVTEDGGNLVGQSLGGSISFDIATNDVVSGSFNIQMFVVDLANETENNVTLSGSFEAPRNDFEMPVGL